jgi:predicted dehydrogenase
MDNMANTRKVTRRDFVKTTAAIGGLTILPSGLLANPPSSKLTYALVGCGGNGGGTTRSMMSHKKLQVVALCDPDKRQMTKSIKKLSSKGVTPQMFQDYREMLTKMKDKIDAIAVSTPDHNHHPVTLQAMKLGMHVYTQKPLTNKISHARELKKVANETGVVNRMGIQLHSSVGNRTVGHYLRSGAIGKIKKVYVWSPKQWGDESAKRKPATDAPAGLDWTAWLGNAPKQPYREGIHPNRWRCYLDFGAGTLGDMGVHIFDTPFKALALTYPNWVKTTCNKANSFGHPTGNTVEYSFAETEYTTKDFRFTWFDGSHAKTKKIPELKLPGKMKFPSQGAVYVGEKGTILHPHMSGAIFFPDSVKQAVAAAKRPTIKPMDHYHDWIDACLANKPSSHADFNYAAALTETVLLGVAGNRFPGEKLEWDCKKMQFTNMPEANKLV